MSPTILSLFNKIYRLSSKYDWRHANERLPTMCISNFSAAPLVLPAFSSTSIGSKNALLLPIRAENGRLTQEKKRCIDTVLLILVKLKQKNKQND